MVAQPTAAFAEVRAARPSEAAALSRLAVRSKAHWGYDEAQMHIFTRELQVKEELLDGERGHVAEQEGRVVGYYTLEECSEHEVYLEHLFIDPSCLRRGHGRLLLDHARRTARAGGYRRIIVWADPFAEDFYLRCGAVPAGRIDSSIPGRTLPVLHIELDGDG